LGRDRCDIGVICSQHSVLSRDRCDIHVIFKIKIPNRFNPRSMTIGCMVDEDSYLPNNHGDLSAPDGTARSKTGHTKGEKGETTDSF